MKATSHFKPKLSLSRKDGKKNRKNEPFSDSASSHLLYSVICKTWNLNSYFAGKVTDYYHANSLKKEQRIWEERQQEHQIYTWVKNNIPLDIKPFTLFQGISISVLHLKKLKAFCLKKERKHRHRKWSLFSNKPTYKYYKITSHQKPCI